MRSIKVRFGSSVATAPATAVAEVRAAIDQPGLSVVLVFCASTYDLDQLGQALRGAFTCPVIGCTTAGQIGPSGYQRGGITAASIASDALEAHPLLIEPLSESHLQALGAAAAARALVERLKPGRSAFGVLLADGLCRSEEALVATLYQALGNVPIVGGSAGDDLTFARTAVYWEGRFLSDAAVFTLFETSHPFSIFKLQHFQPGGRRLVITAADTSARRVLEIDGFPAAEAYAAAVGVPESSLTAAVFSANPLMLRIGGDHYIRSISKVGPDRSLEFFCAIDEGLVLSLGQAEDPVQALRSGLAEATRGTGRPAILLGCDCILRRLELETKGLDVPVGRLLADWKVVGFSTFGEQLNAVHINQTFTGLALGE
jgi:hypothetical protein